MVITASLQMVTTSMKRKSFLLPRFQVGSWFIYLFSAYVQGLLGSPYVSTHIVIGRQVFVSSLLRIIHQRIYSFSCLRWRLSHVSGPGKEINSLSPTLLQLSQNLNPRWLKCEGQCCDRSGERRHRRWLGNSAGQEVATGTEGLCKVSLKAPDKADGVPRSNKNSYLVRHFTLAQALTPL